MLHTPMQSTPRFIERSCRNRTAYPRRCQLTIRGLVLRYPCARVIPVRDAVVISEFLPVLQVGEVSRRERRRGEGGAESVGEGKASDAYRMFSVAFVLL